MASSQLRLHAWVHTLASNVLGTKKKKANVHYSLFFFVSSTLWRATGLLIWTKILRDGRESAAISSKLIVVDWNIIVVRDRLLSKPRPGVQVVPGGRKGGMERRREGH